MFKPQRNKDTAKNNYLFFCVGWWGFIILSIEILSKTNEACLLLHEISIVQKCDAIGDDSSNTVISIYKNE
ncbi:MAG: hypothetical protein C4330_00470 [Chitinophagaceae bacterium]